MSTSPSHPSTPTAPDTNTATIARQAIVDGKGNVYGYELFDRTRPSRTHDASSDAQMLLNVLSHAGTASLLGRRNVFINCAFESLQS